MEQNKLRLHTCYLSGPMEEVADRGKGWRDFVTVELRKRNIISLDPLNKPMLHDKFSEDDKFVEIRKEFIINKDYDALSELMRKQVCRVDLSLVDKADFLIAYIDKAVFMCGTIWELCVAANQRKPVLVVCKQGKINTPAWLFGVLNHEAFFSNWDELLEHIDSIDSGKVVPSKYWRFFDMEKIYGI